MNPECRDKCGVFLACDLGGNQVAMALYWGLVSQNHRGHHSYGLLTFEGKMHRYSGLGLVPSLRRFLAEGAPERLRGGRGIAHVRYATSGGGDPELLAREAQPYQLGEQLALAYNGNLVNVHTLREATGAVCEVEAAGKKILEKLGGGLFPAVENFVNSVEGAYSVVGMTGTGCVFAFRDPLGIRPLCWGKKGELFAVSSETVGLDINGISPQSDVSPGELMVLTEGGLERVKVAESPRRALCAFEFAYVARPDSVLDGGSPVYKVREEFGRNLAREYPDEARKVDVVISIPETGDDAAYGFHEETGIHWERAVRRHRFITDRAFISSTSQRELILSKKINVSREIRGKKVAVIDDSIVRGDTSRKIIRQIREAGATEVYLFVTFPKIIAPCFYGIDMATFGELAASKYSEEEIAKMIGADKVCYQSLEGYIRATRLRKEELCLGCLTCQYPTPLAQKMADRAKSRFLAGEKEAGRIYESVLDFPG
jgi:amidophosphoribosyltransferase